MNSHVLQFSAISIALLGLVNFLLVWILHRQWWKIKAVRRASWLFPVTGVLIVALWGLASYLEFSFGSMLFGFLTVFCFIASIAFLLALPFSGTALTLERIVRWIAKRIDRKKTSSNAAPSEQQPARSHVPADADTVDTTRRSIITVGSAALPALTVGLGTYGMISSEYAVKFPNVEMFFDDLHPDLDGLRILHITDLHLGYSITLDSLEKTLINAEKQRPDLVLLSGDISDDLPVLPEALRMISQLRPRYGTFASLGNHEYHRGISQVLKIFDAGPVPLFVENGETVKIGKAELYIGAADDPVAAGQGVTGDHEDFLQRSVSQAFDGAPSQAFQLLMSHRPEGFNQAARMNLDLTVAGHKHGGAQIGWNGRSLAETWFGLGEYTWGYYEKNNGASKLYTSAGAGHWFPFRLGVPREAPVYILRRGKGSSQYTENGSGLITTSA